LRRAAHRLAFQYRRSYPHSVAWVFPECNDCGRVRAIPRKKLAHFSDQMFVFSLLSWLFTFEGVGGV
jgi:hypothetical protein